MKKGILIIGMVMLSSVIVAQKKGQINCYCEGDGKYTFVLEAGLGNWSLFFRPLFQELKTVSRVCLIDRKGYTGLDRNSTPRDAETVAKEMKSVLAGSGIEEAVILVGHSMGGLNVRMFQNLYPEMVDGLILLDAAPPLLWEKMPELKSGLEQQISQMEKIRKLAKLGFLPFAKKKIPTFGLPSEYHKDYYKVVTRAYYYDTYIREMKALGESLDQCKKIGDLGDLPLLVISSWQGINKPLASEDQKGIQIKDNNWLELQKGLSLLSSNSQYVESPKDHFVQLSDLQLVIREIKHFYKKNFGPKVAS